MEATELGSMPQTEKPFFSELKKRVDQYIIENDLDRGAHKPRLGKAAYLYTSFGLMYGCYLYFGSIHWGFAVLFAFGYALTQLVIQFGIMHEGSHQAVKSKHWYQSPLQYAISFMGGSSIFWIRQHCYAHHNHTNVHGKDNDIDSSGMLRLHPSQPKYFYHRYQHIYAWPLYLGFLVYWVWWTDFADLIKNPHNLDKRTMRKAAAEIALIKIWHAFLFLALPYFFFGSVGTVLASYLLAFMIVGAFMAIVFQCAHVTEVQELPHTTDEVSKDWAIKQIQTTANFATTNRFLTWLIGSLNHQIEHHIFPTMSQKNYPKIQKVVQEFCESRGITYHNFPSLRAVLAAHQRHLYRLGH